MAYQRLDPHDPDAIKRLRKLHATVPNAELIALVRTRIGDRKTDKLLHASEQSAYAQGVIDGLIISTDRQVASAEADIRRLEQENADLIWRLKRAEDTAQLNLNHMREQYQQIVHAVAAEHQAVIDTHLKRTEYYERFTTRRAPIAGPVTVRPPPHLRDTTPEPAASTSAAPKPAAPKPAVPKPAVPKPAAPRPAAPAPAVPAVTQAPAAPPVAAPPAPATPPAPTPAATNTAAPARPPTPPAAAKPTQPRPQAPTHAQTKHARKDLLKSLKQKR